MNNEIYQKKIKGCEMLSEKNVKKINRTHIIEVANKVGLSAKKMEYAWNNFVQSGGRFVDNRGRTAIGTKNKMQVNGATFSRRNIPSQKGLRRNVPTKEIRKILFEYLTTSDSLVKVAAKHGVAYDVAYSWIRELTVSGTIKGELILDFKKYAKLPIIDVFYFYKHPNTTRASIANLTQIEKSAYIRVANVLLNYLPVKE